MTACDDTKFPAVVTCIARFVKSSACCNAVGEGCRALATPRSWDSAATDNHRRCDGAVSHMTSTEQPRTALETSKFDTALHQISEMLTVSDGDLRGVEQVANLHLHGGSDGGAKAPDICSVSGSGPDAGSGEDGIRRTASTAEQPTYCDKAYWDNRYARELAPGSAAPPYFDWYIGYPGSPLQDILREHVPLAMPVLQVGVGTSQMQRQMVEDGYQNILSTDVSAAAVEHLRALHADVPQLSYDVGDCRSMPQYEDAAFAAVIDKGTLDAIMCGEHAEADAVAMVLECHRVLQPGGVFLEVSYGRPSLRLPYLQPPGVEWAAVTASGVRHPQACGEVPDGETVIKLPPLLGPYDASEAGVLNGIEVDNYYFAYVCRKPC